MFRPDDVSKRYAAILPQLRALGYACRIVGSLGEQVCTMSIGRAATVDIYNDGTWTRRDGFHGRTPQELLDLMRQDRGDEVARHLARHDLRALAQDALNAQGVEAASIRAVRPLDDGGMEADVFIHNKMQTIRIGGDVHATCRRWRIDLIS